MSPAFHLPQLLMCFYLAGSLGWALGLDKKLTKNPAASITNALVGMGLCVLLQWWGGFWTEPKPTSWHIPQYIQAVGTSFVFLWAIFMLNFDARYTKSTLAHIVRNIVYLIILTYGGFWGVTPVIS